MKLDVEMWQAQCEDWFHLTWEQQQLAEPLFALSEQIRRAELERSVRAASLESLRRVQQRLIVLTQDRQQKWQLLHETIAQICTRELNLGGPSSASSSTTPNLVVLHQPKDTVPLTLPTNTSVLGLFGQPLLMAGELLPIG